MDKKKFLWENCNGIVEDSRIEFIEQQLEISFPQSYKMIIKNCDGGIPIKSQFDFIDESFNTKNTDCIGSFLRLNCLENNNFLENNLYSPPEFFPKNIIAFASNGGGDFICFDYRQNKKSSDPPIVYWSHGADIGKDISFIAKNFETFLSILKEFDS